MIEKMRHIFKCFFAFLKTIMLMLGLLLIIIGWKLGIRCEIKVEGSNFTAIIDSPEKVYNFIKDVGERTQN